MSENIDQYLDAIANSIDNPKKEITLSGYQIQLNAINKLKRLIVDGTAVSSKPDPSGFLDLMYRETESLIDRLRNVEKFQIEVQNPLPQEDKTLDDVLKPGKKELIFRAMYELNIIDENGLTKLGSRQKSKLLAFAQSVHERNNLMGASVSIKRLMTMFQVAIKEKPVNVNPNRISYKKFKTEVDSYLNDNEKPVSWPPF